MGAVQQILCQRSKLIDPPPPTSRASFARLGPRHAQGRVGGGELESGASLGRADGAIFPIRISNSGYAFAFSRHDVARVLRFVVPREKREHGMPDARCTRGLVCKYVRKKTHTSIQVQRRHSGIPRAMALRLMLKSQSSPCNSLARLTLPRPPHPIPTFVTMANAPSLGTGCRSFKSDLPDGESGNLPVGLFCRSHDRHQAANA